MRIWVIEWDATYTGGADLEDKYSGFSIVNAETRDNAERIVKSDLKRQGFDWTRVKSMTFRPLPKQKILYHKEWYKNGS